MQHLINYLPQLHPFYINTMKTLHPDDQKQMTEAVSHILSEVPVKELGGAMQLFCLPVAQKLHDLISKSDEEQLHAAHTLQIRCIFKVM